MDQSIIDLSLVISCLLPDARLLEISQKISVFVHFSATTFNRGTVDVCLCQVLWLYCSAASVRRITHTTTYQSNLRPEPRRSANFLFI